MAEYRGYSPSLGSIPSQSTKHGIVPGSVRYQLAKESEEDADTADVHTPSQNPKTIRKKKHPTDDSQTQLAIKPAHEELVSNHEVDRAELGPEIAAVVGLALDHQPLPLNVARTLDDPEVARRVTSVALTDILARNNEAKVDMVGAAEALTSLIDTVAETIEQHGTAENP